MHFLRPPIHGNDKLKKTNNKLFLCLRPAVVEDFLANSKGGTAASQVLKLIDMERKDGVLFPSVYPSPEGDAAIARQNKKSKKKFLRAVKAVFFETSLAKKIKKRTSTKKKKYSTGETISNVDKDLDLVKEKLLHQKLSKKFTGRNIVSYYAPSVNSSSVCSSAPSLNNSKRFLERVISLGPSNPILENNIKKQENGKVHYGSNTGLFLLLVTLTVLVLWGKVYAILCTSTWLFFVPNWSNVSGKKLLKNGRVHSQSMDLEEYKKKIIMEGFLDRNRNRFP
ncbi:uncharacterized protein LOC8282933 [Ricinus communis]|uniref:uncharacterized protein LOC8282933 n=1 Tax=Ricinus communis TaxID=3988 RepID=UPI00201ADCFE|nr:uncharacterized protein LOC8282933 [Ricinus communis]